MIDARGLGTPPVETGHYDGAVQDQPNVDPLPGEKTLEGEKDCHGFQHIDVKLLEGE